MFKKRPIKAYSPLTLLRHFIKWCRGWWRRSLAHKALAILLVVIMLCVSSMYGIAQWYIMRHRHEPLQLGATFIADYARNLGVEPKETMQAMIDDLGIRHFRLVSYWENIEPVPGVYDFSELDWQFAKAQAAGASVSLAVGLRQPRWPECHMPTWAATLPRAQWEPKLKAVMQAVVERYRSHPVLVSYQLENEFFLKVFGICPDHSRDRLISEYQLVRRLDPHHPLIVSRSNNAIGWPIGEPQTELSAVSVYKRVWDKTLTKRYFEYPIPAWYYGFLAGWYELVGGPNTFIHELQAEAWTPDGFDIRTAPTEELYKSLNPDRLRHRFRYGIATGMKRIDLWGVEWWYAMKINRDAPELWDVAKEEYARSQQ